MGQAFGIMLMLVGATMWHIAVGKSSHSSNPNPLLGIWKDFGHTANQLTTGGSSSNNDNSLKPGLGGDQGNGTVILS